MKYFLLFLTMLPFFCSCNDEDNVQKIFQGAWKLNNFYLTSNWKNDKDRKPVYEKLEEWNKMSTFNIVFEESTFNVQIGESNRFSGTWSADGKDHTFYLRITEGNTSSNDAMIQKFITDLQNARYYDGDSNMLRLYNPERNAYMQFRR